MRKRGWLLPVLAGILLILLIIGFLGGSLGKSLFGDLGLPSWLTIPRPDPHLPAEVILHVFGFPVTNTIIAAWLTVIVLSGMFYAVTRRMKLIPSRWQSLLEFVIERLLSFCQNVAGEKNGRRFFPIVATIFLFVIGNAWLSLLPGFGSISIFGEESEAVHLLRGANTDINLPLALALVSFVFVEYFGLRTLGVRYLKKFINVDLFFRSLGQLFKGKIKAGLGGLFNGLIDIFVGLLELLSELIRIVSFTARLFGNMTAGEILLLIAAFLVPWVLALPFYGLELLVGLVQALIFAGLTLVFVTLAVTSHDSEH